MGTRPTSMRGERVEDDTELLEKEFDQFVSKASEFYGPECKKSEVMDTPLFNCLKQGNSSTFIHVLNLSLQNQQPLSTFLNKSTPSGNTVLHVAAGSPSAHIVKLLVRFPELFERTNSMEDTPLHVSATVGNIKATALLINSAEEHQINNFLGRKNKKGNTALHNAVINNRHDVAKSLLNAGPTVAYMENRELKSPLYLAAQNDDKDMLHIILEVISKFEYPSSLQGKSPANAAIERRNLDMLKDMESLRPELICHKDEKGEIPLHFSSRIGYFEGVEFLLEKHTGGAFERNKKGLYPIHVACRKGHINVVDRLLKEWLDPMEQLTSKGQTILHVSAEKGRNGVVVYLLKIPEIVEIINEKDEDGNTALHLATMRGRSMAVYSLVKSGKVNWKILNNDNMAPFQVIEHLINKLDEEAKDEKHDSKSEENKMIAKKQNHLHVDEQHDTKSVNETTTKKQNHLQASEKHDTKLEEKEATTKKQNQLQDEKHDKKSEENKSTTKKQNHLHWLNYYEAMMTSAILHFHGSSPKGIKEYMEIPTKPLSKDELKTRIENLLVVAILVASVTFAGAIQIPNSNDHGGGKEAIPASKDNSLLKVYIYLDVMALNTSIMASLILCWAKVTTHLIWLASILIGLSIYLMCLAFVFAAAIAVSESTVAFSVLLLAAILLLLFQTVLCLPLIIPPNESKAVEKIASPYIYYCIFRFYLFFQRWITRLLGHHHKK